jgi:TRAP-type C4-dicarboxylate transport system permease small subunit
MNGTSSSRRRLDYVAYVVETVVILAIIVNIAVTFSNTLLRYTTNQDLPWNQDISTIILSIITFLGAPSYFRRSTGMAYNALIEKAEGARREALRACGLAIFLGVCCLALFAYPRFFASQSTQSLAVLGISSVFVAVWLGIGLVLLSLYTLEKLFGLSCKGVLAGSAMAATIAATTLLLRWIYDEGYIEVDPFIAIVPALVVAFITGTPVAGILALGGTMYFVISDAAPITVIPSAIQFGISSFVLLAVPFFMVAGVMMEITGMARRMVEMVQAWVGHWRGGLLMAEVLATYLFSGVSGSKAADVATIGTVMKEPMKKQGYPSTEFVAVLAASGHGRNRSSVCGDAHSGLGNELIGRRPVHRGLPASGDACSNSNDRREDPQSRQQLPQGCPFRPMAGPAQHSSRTAGGRSARTRHRRARGRYRLANRIGLVCGHLRVCRRRFGLSYAWLALIHRGPP